MWCIFKPEQLSWEDIDGGRGELIAVLSLIDGAFHDSMAADRISEKLTKSATKPDLVKIITHVASLYCWYISLKARIEQAEAEK